LQEAFWTRFGVRLEDLDHWPQKKVEDFIQIMNIESQVQAAKDKSGTQQTQQQTEEAYRAMKNRQDQA
jgi:hypothetical protein